MKNRISVALAVYNEQRNLGRCLESVKDIAWEIVVVDGGSKDRTVDIAKSFNAKVIRARNLPNFHVNKNKAIDASLGDWILQLDADEVVPYELAEEIKEVVSKNSDIAGFWIPRKNFFLGKFLQKGGQYPDYTLRLYRRGKGRLPAKDVHEQAQVIGKVSYLKNDLLHLRDKNFAIYIERFNRYTDLIAKHLQESGVKRNTLSFIDYIFVKPLHWFIKAYFRHLGFLDGFPGFVFALFSALRFPFSYIKLWINHATRSN